MKLSPGYLACSRILFCITVLMITCLATAELESTAVVSVQDKLNHFVAFLVLAFLLDFSFPGSRFNTKKILLLFSYGVGLEVIQYYLPNRMFSLFDVGANILGLLGYSLLIPFIKRLPILKDRWVK